MIEGSETEWDGLHIDIPLAVHGKSIPAMEILLSGSEKYWQWFCGGEGRVYELFDPFLNYPYAASPVVLMIYVRKIMTKCHEIINADKRQEFKMFAHTLYFITWRLIESKDFQTDTIKQKWASWSIDKHARFGYASYAENLKYALYQRKNGTVQEKDRQTVGKE